MATLQQTPTPTSVEDLKVGTYERIPLGGGISMSPPQWTVFCHDMKLAYWLSSALSVVAAVVSAAAVFHPSLFRDPAMTAGNARGTDLAILVVTVPLLLVSIIATARGSVRATIVWLGALSYVLYNAVLFAFDVAFNQMFLLYVAALSLAIWSLVALLLGIDVARVQACITNRLPVRTIAAYLVATTILFALTWLRDILPGLVRLTTPASLHGTLMLTNPIQVMDFAVGFPVTILAAVWLWQRRPWGYVLVGMFLVYGVIEALSVATDQTFGHLSDPAQPIAIVPVFAALTLVALVPLALYLSAIRRWPLDRAA